MKTILITSVMILLSTMSFGQHPVSVIAYNTFNYKKLNPLFIHPTAPFSVEGLPTGWRMRNVGSTLTLAGAFLAIGGTVVYNNIERTNQYASPYPQQNEPKGNIGALMIVGGVGMIVPGVIFWAKGARKYKRFLAEEANSYASISMNVNGVQLAYRF